jgi:hypothetical protein
MTSSKHPSSVTKLSLAVLALALAMTTITGAGQAQSNVSPLGPAQQADNAQGRFQHRGPRTTPGDDTPGKPVPEPSTMALASMGLVALGGAYRRFRTR